MPWRSLPYLFCKAILSLGCGFVACYDPEFRQVPTHSAVCQPNLGMDACVSNLDCCSDDPSTLDGQIPQYSWSLYSGGIPIFSEANNSLSYSGICFDLGQTISPLANGCPIPCNPQWDRATLDTLCGTDSCCFQTRQVDPDNDCIFDQKTRRWRAVTGSDLFRTDVQPPTNWSGHTTQQDPNGLSCQAITQDNNPGSPANNDCYRQLTVANQRGFCASICACVEDLCDLKNPDAVPRCSYTDLVSTSGS